MLAEFSSLSFPEGSNKRRRKDFDLRLEHGADFGENERLAQGVLCANRPTHPGKQPMIPAGLRLSTDLPPGRAAQSMAFFSTPGTP